LCVGRSGTVWAAITESAPEGVNLLHLVSYRVGDAAPVDHGGVAIRNPDYTQFTTPDGKQLPFHGGLYKTADGKTTTRYVIMGVCEGLDDNVYILALHPYTLLQVPVSQLRR
jgi:hypothetical protein